MKSSIHYQFGDKLRKVRERKGITLKSVAQTIQVSESLISQIERNKVSPSIDTLLRIAEVLEIDLEYLFQDFKRDKEITLVRKKDRDQMVLQDINYEIMSLLEDAKEGTRVEVMEMIVPPGKTKGDTEYGHRGSELGVILDGSAELQYGTKVYQLSKGDSISFSSEIPHILVNKGTEPLKALWIVTPPRFFKKG